jgi:Big-like domain-containing protein
MLQTLNGWGLGARPVGARPAGHPDSRRGSITGQQSRRDHQPLHGHSRQQPQPLGTASVSATGTAACTTLALAGGSDRLYVVYQGSANYLGSTSAAISQTVTFTSACIATTVNGAITVKSAQSICVPNRA